MLTSPSTINYFDGPSRVQTVNSSRIPTEPASYHVGSPTAMMDTQSKHAKQIRQQKPWIGNSATTLNDGGGYERRYSHERKRSTAHKLAAPRDNTLQRKRQSEVNMSERDGFQKKRSEVTQNRRSTKTQIGWRNQQETMNVYLEKNEARVKKSHHNLFKDYDRPNKTNADGMYTPMLKQINRHAMANSRAFSKNKNAIRQLRSDLTITQQADEALSLERDTIRTTIARDLSNADSRATIATRVRLRKQHSVAPQLQYNRLGGAFTTKNQMAQIRQHRQSNVHIRTPTINGVTTGPAVSKLVQMMNSHEFDVNGRKSERKRVMSNIFGVKSETTIENAFAALPTASDTTLEQSNHHRRVKTSAQFRSDNITPADSEARTIEPSARGLSSQRSSLPSQMLFEVTRQKQQQDCQDNTLRLNNYQFGKVIGQGAYAAVKLVMDRITRKKYAVKIYEKHRLNDPMKRKAAQREITVLKRLKHPNLIELHDLIDTKKHIYIFTDYVKGGSLKDYSKAQRNRMIRETSVRRIFRQLVEAVYHLHSANIVHRDIKLDNILIQDGTKTVKLIDFGFSVVSNGQKLKIFCGTPSYMSPEITRRSEYDGKPVDMWALGVLLYQMLAGVFPFRGTTEGELFKKIEKGAFKGGADGVSPGARKIISLLLLTDPLKRMKIGDLVDCDYLKENNELKISVFENLGFLHRQQEKKRGQRLEPQPLAEIREIHNRALEYLEHLGYDQTEVEGVFKSHHSFENIRSEEICLYYNRFIRKVLVGGETIEAAGWVKKNYRQGTFDQATTIMNTEGDNVPSHLVADL